MPTLIAPEDLSWRSSSLMQIPNADFLERTGSEKLAARLWRLPPGSASTLHRHVRQEEFYLVLEGTGRIRVGTTTYTVPRHGAIHVLPAELRQIFNDTPEHTLWLVVGGPEELEFMPGKEWDRSLLYPQDPTQLPTELKGKTWPPPSTA
ncbi:MAG: cupin domain-containing protein [Opitutaceae bacterium]|nr:cupin domain-containing protein [Opitutaceae bacterium]